MQVVDEAVVVVVGGGELGAKAAVGGCAVVFGSRERA